MLKTLSWMLLGSACILIIIYAAGTYIDSKNILITKKDPPKEFIESYKKTMSDMIASGYISGIDINLIKRDATILHSTVTEQHRVAGMAKRVASRINRKYGASEIGMLAIDVKSKDDLYCNIIIGENVNEMLASYYEIDIYHEVAHCNEILHGYLVEGKVGCDKQCYSENSGDSILSEGFDKRYSLYLVYIREIYADLVSASVVSKWNNDIFSMQIKRRDYFLGYGDFVHYSVPYLARQALVNTENMSLEEIMDTATLTIKEVNSAKEFYDLSKKKSEKL
jgi:hypothetical protein